MPGNNKLCEYVARKKKGMSLMEVIVAVALFVMIMIMVSGVFASFYKTLVAARAEQRSIEDANNAVNVMAKVLRTSKIKIFAQDKIVAWDYSDTSGKPCSVFQFMSSGTMIGGTDSNIGSNGEANCGASASVSSVFAVEGVTGSFDSDITGNDPSTIKRVTIQVNSNKTGNISPTSMQTSVYLRN